MKRSATVALAAALLVTLGTAGVAQAKIKWDFQLVKKVGQERFEKLTTEMPEQSSLSMAQSLGWVMDIIDDDKVEKSDWVKMSDWSTGLGDQIAQTVQGKTFENALGEMGYAFAKADFIMTPIDKPAKWSEKKLKSAISDLGAGHYLVFAYPKTSKSGLFFTFGLEREAKSYTVFDPYAGMFTESGSKTTAKYMLGKVAEGNSEGDTVDTFWIVQTSRKGGFDLNQVKKALTTAAKEIDKGHAKITSEELKKGSDKNWFGRDFLRFLDGLQIVSDKRTIRERYSGMDANETLLKLVASLGSDWEAPEGAEYYDVEQGGNLEKYVAETLTNKDNLYKVFSLMSQKGLTNVAKDFRDAAERAGITPPLRFANRNSLGDRYDDHDKWCQSVIITEKEVRVIHYITLVEGFDAPTPFKARLILERVLTRKNGKVKCEDARIEAKKDGFDGPPA
jgi:hypothetical protein